MKKTRMKLAAGLVGVLAISVPALVVAQEEEPPPLPPFVDPDTGLVDESAVPDRIPVSGDDGSIVGFVQKEDLFRQGHPSDAKASRSDAQPEVPVYNDRGTRIGILTANGVRPDDAGSR